MIRFTPAYALFRCSFRCVRHVTLPYRPHITPLLASLEDGRGARAPGSKTPGSAGEPGARTLWSQRQESPGGFAALSPLRVLRALARCAGKRLRRFLSSAPATGFDSGGRQQNARLRGEPGARTQWSQRQESPCGFAALSPLRALRALARCAGKRLRRFLSSAPATGFDSGGRQQNARLRRGTGRSDPMEPATGIEPATH